MEYRTLGDTGVDVSVICLGTMTYGEQNNEAEGHAQLDYAFEHGINFIDTAELYAFPASAETCGRTEQIIGSWIQSRGVRDQIILATKIAGPGPDWIDHIRGGNSRFDRTNIETALDGSLRRLRTDYIDLYQLHWPERKTNFFGHLGYQHNEPDNFTPIEETLRVLGELVTRGKIRYIGLSNETQWGVMMFIETAERLGLPRAVSVQNPYNLLNRTFEIGLAEIAHRESTGLLAYSPLAFGILSGKYLLGRADDRSRLKRFSGFTRYDSEQAQAATRDYVQLAIDHDLDPGQMALAWVNSRSFLTSNIIGATTMEQLKKNIASVTVRLSAELREGIEAIHQRFPNPSP